MNVSRFYAILSVYNYATKSTYIEENRILCTFYAVFGELGARGSEKTLSA